MTNIEKVRAALAEIEREKRQAEWTRDLAQSASTRDLEAKRVAERELAIARALLGKSAKELAGWNEHYALHAELRAFLEPPVHPEADARKACVVEPPAVDEHGECPNCANPPHEGACRRKPKLALGDMHGYEDGAVQQREHQLVADKPAECGCAARKALEEMLQRGYWREWMATARAALATPCDCQGLRGIFRYTCGHYRGPGSEAGPCVICAELAAALERERKAVDALRVYANPCNWQRSRENGPIDLWESTHLAEWDGPELAAAIGAAFDARKEGQ